MSTTVAVAPALGARREQHSQSAYGQLVSSEIAQTASSAERALSYFRIGFSSLVLAGFAFNSSIGFAPSRLQTALELGANLGAISFSLWVLRTTRRHVLSRATHLVSVVVDALIATLALASNWFIHPSSQAAPYDGSLSSLDVAIFPLVVTLSIFRLSQAAVLTSAAATLLGVAVVVGVEYELGYPLRADKLVLLLVYHFGAVAAALLFTRWFVSTLHGTSSASVRAERARSGLLALLTDHHDLRSSISDVRMNAERLHEKLVPVDRAGVGQEYQLSQSVTQGLLRITDFLHTTSDRVLRVLDGSGDLQPTSVDGAARAAAQAFRSLWPEVRVELVVERDLPPALFGGEDALARLLLNLLVNSAEGGASGGAGRIAVEARVAGAGCLELCVADDGPGVPQELLDRVGQRGFSTKPRSSGLGLWLAESAVVVAGGRLQLSSTPNGATVRLLLRTLP
jgi:signal transduction histidine kinase